MPTWPTHILIARKLNKKLNLGSDFILGNVTADAINHYLTAGLSKYISHSESHYHYDNDGKFTPKINIDFFLNKYREKLTNPIVFGYLVHLLTDSFFNEYTYNSHYINKDIVILNDGQKHPCSRAVRTRMKQKDFEIYGHFLATTNDLGDPIDGTENTYKYLKELDEIEYQKSDMDKIINSVNKVIKDKNLSTQKYTIFTEEELNKVFDECYEYIINFLNKIENG